MPELDTTMELLYPTGSLFGISTMGAVLMENEPDAGGLAVAFNCAELPAQMVASAPAFILVGGEFTTMLSNLFVPLPHALLGVTVMLPEELALKFMLLPPPVNVPAPLYVQA